MATILRTPSATARRREWAAQSRQRLVLQRQAEKRIASEIRRAGNAAADGFENGRDAGLALGLVDHEARMTAILEAEYRRTFDVFGRDLIASSRSAGLGYEKRDTEGVFQSLVLRWINQFGGLKIQRITATTRNQIIRAVEKGEQEGEGVEQIAKRIRESTSGFILRARSLVIARTEIHSASQAATDTALDALEIPEIRREWVAAEDNRTRETHNIADGQVRDQGEAFNVGGFNLQHPGDPSGPAQEIINCFPAWTRVGIANPLAVTRHYYSGPLVEITTRSGNKLSGTPNHPVLTIAGWKALGEIDHRDHLLNCVVTDRMGARNPDIAGAYASIGEVFDAAHRIGPIRRVSGGSVNFHGERPRHDVDVVRSNGVLRGHGISSAHQEIGKFFLPHADLAKGLLLAACLTNEKAFLAWLAANSVVRRFCESLSFRFAGLAHAKPQRFASAASGNVGLLQTLIDFGSASNTKIIGDRLNGLPSVESIDDIAAYFVSAFLIAYGVGLRCGTDDAAFVEMTGDGVSTASALAGKLRNANSGQIQISHVINKRVIEFSGHVYNLHDPTGWFVAENIIAHNCRCVTAAVIPEDL